jgi:hypothetical protein
LKKDKAATDSGSDSEDDDIDMQVLDSQTMEYLKTFWTGNDMVSQLTTSHGCYEWVNEESATSTCQ